MSLKTTFRKIGLFLGVELTVAHMREKLIAALGGGIAILGVFYSSAYLLSDTHLLWVVPSMGASTVLIFAVPHGQLSQPWPVLGGHFISALIGVACYQWIPNAFWAAAAAIALAIFAMQILRCIHPPGGATALMAVLGGAEVHNLGYAFAVTPVFLNSLLLIGLGIAINALFPWRRYPARTSLFAKPPVSPPLVMPPFNRADLEYALQQMESFVDITAEDLQQIYKLAADHARESSKQ